MTALALVGQAAAAGGAEEAGLARVGRLMFFDPSLSASGKLACATCHDPRYAYGPPPGKALAHGGPDMAQPGTRAVPSLRYLEDLPPFAVEHHFLDGDVGPIGGFTWDGRATSPRDQARIPLLAANEMANASPADVARKLGRAPYAALMRQVFGPDLFRDPERAFAAGLQALEAFERVPEEFHPYSSRYDAYLRGEIELTDEEERGVALFKDPAKGNCASCHLGVSRGGKPPPFTDYDFANVGVPRNPRIPANRDPRYFDAGLCGPVRVDLADKREFCGFFRSPTVRNVAIRDAFFHNGAFTTLREVMHFYVERDLHPEKYYPRNADGSVRKYDDLPPGIPVNVDRDPPLDRDPGAAPALTEAEIDDIIAFLRTLTDADVAGAGSSASAEAEVSSPPGTLPRRPAGWIRHHADEYAWRLFVALDWPADPQSGGADGRRPLGAPGPVVWERWLSARRVYREDGADPGPWSAAARPADSPDAQRFESFSLKDFPRPRHVVNGRMEDLVDPLPGARRLTEIRLDRRSYEFIRSRQLYNVEGQLRAVRSAEAVSFPAGATEVKAKWRPISEAERDRYHSLRVTHADGSTRLYGLTALAIASKALPTWFWATFEHVDNPSLADSEGWGLPSRDRFGCAGRRPDCNGIPRGLALEGTVWSNYRLRGTQTDFVDAAGGPQRLANSELEAGFQTSASCMTCHARASIDARSAAGTALRLPIFAAAAGRGDPLVRRGFVGRPQSTWFAPSAAGASRFVPLDFVWSLSQARPRAAGGEFP